MSFKLQITTLLVAAGLLSAFQPGMAQRRGTSRVDALSQGTSNNWAGYIRTGGPFVRMRGSWTVPSVSYVRYPGSNDAEVTATWIGIGGNSDKSLIQLGTTQGIQYSGSTRYYAWYLLVDGLNNAAMPLPYPLAPGDRIEASLACVADCTPNIEQSWRMSLRNATQGWTWDNNGAVFRYKSSLASAEWIMEASTRQAGGAISKLPSFGSVQFDSATLNGGNPMLDLLRDGLAIVDSNGAPIAVPSLAQGDGSFAVKQAGVPPQSGYPDHPVRNMCRDGTDLGELTQTARRLEGSVPVGSRRLYAFYLPWFSRVDAILLAPPPRKVQVFILGDEDGARFSTEINGADVMLDPGYYCIEFTPNTGPGDSPFRVDLSATRVGFPPPTHKENPYPIAQLELGNLSHNGYYDDTRYIRFQGGQVGPLLPVELIPGHFYVLRDWIGPSLDQQWYRFITRRTLHLQVDLQAPYLGSYASLETSDGSIVAATASRGIPLTPFLASQRFEGDLPAATYFLRIGFAGIGAPGTPFSLSLEAH